MMSGKVYLVGAGPGDGGLITVKGRQLIRSADVIVCDRLVGDEVLELIPPETETIYVGKNAGFHPVPQEEINRILLEQAKAGRSVVRLKGGDPFVFGRGGEELELLAAEGIDFEVVPGVTASIAAPAYGGIPVTHRDCCSSLHIITGHARAGKKLDIDYEALVRLNGTLVFMMSVSTAGQIAEGLLKAGMDPQMPCAVIERGTLPGQRTLTGELAGLEELVRRNGVRSPAVIMTGRVCALADRFRWFEDRPLLGRRILVTQPESRSSRLAEGLRKLGAQAILYPCIRTVPIRPLSVPEAEPVTGRAFDTIVFTSAAGVRSWCEWLLESGRDMRDFAGKRIACIGSATARELKSFGVRADFVPSEYSGQALGREMIGSGFVGTDSCVLLLRTRRASADVTEALAAAGIPFADVPVYETQTVQQPPLEEAAADLITFTSRSCVEGFAAVQKRDRFEGCRALCIGQQTAARARECGFDVIVSDEASIESMLEKVKQTGGK